MQAPRPTNAALLLNTAAGRRPGRIPEAEIVRRLTDCGMHVTLTTLSGTTDPTAAALTAVAAGRDLVIAGGGDGTVSAVAGVLAGTPTRLGILPLGTLNHFAADLGIPPALPEAIETICRGRFTAVDVGKVNGRVFINNSSLGYYPNALHRRDELRHRLGHGKWLAFLSAILFVFRRFPLLDLRITLDDRTTLARRTPLLFVGNNRYELTATRFGLRERLDAGRLSAHIINRTERLGLLVLAANALLGRLPKRSDFETLSARLIEVTARRGHVEVATDGELTRLATPLIYEITPRSLWVAVPEQRNDRRP